MTCVADLQVAMNKVKTGWPGIGQTALTNHALSIATELALHRDQLAEKLNVQDTWLRDHPDHPKAEQRTDQWIRNLREYESICDALNEAKTVLLA